MARLIYGDEKLTKKELRQDLGWQMTVKVKDSLEFNQGLKFCANCHRWIDLKKKTKCTKQKEYIFGPFAQRGKKVFKTTQEEV